MLVTLPPVFSFTKYLTWRKKGTQFCFAKHRNQPLVAWYLHKIRLTVLEDVPSNYTMQKIVPKLKASLHKAKRHKKIPDAVKVPSFMQSAQVVLNYTYKLYMGSLRSTQKFIAQHIRNKRRDACINTNKFTGCSSNLGAHVACWDPLETELTRIRNPN